MQIHVNTLTGKVITIEVDSLTQQWRRKPPPSGFSILLSLPIELQRDIIDLMDIPSQMNLRLTSHHYYSLIPRPTHIELLSVEKTPWAQEQEPKLFSCMDCLRLRPKYCFADAMTKGPKGINGKEPHKRFCLDCGLHPKPRTTRYSPGAEITVGGIRHVFCKNCKKYSDDVGPRGSGRCRDCPSGDKVLTRRRGKNRRGLWASYEDDYELPDGYDTDFWECYDPAD